ncbi:uncharacterized protein LOC110606724 isoform X2 [Manihot esculenta]|uniref:Uncharacterized protein n=2 Tax=Manihot esculenta TaxID=3983 RepID=A0ACB7FYB7_MANES|nr:uncharacterized protein LOC110606724 isoform X2 [Manihot esculenta]KAG8632495.1 hypothetical protein MANES_18G027500v8 [Manihot esculenta]KAG8632496.1 hypothetical protein MANES_18G027500v8 [Manihot esculenta]
MARGMVYYFARLFPLLCVSGLASVSLYLSPSLSSLLDGLPNKHPSPPRLTGNKNAGIKIVLPELDHLSESTPGALIAPTLGLLVLDELRQICWGLLSLDAIRVASCALKVLPGPLLCGACCEQTVQRKSVVSYPWSVICHYKFSRPVSVMFCIPDLHFYFWKNFWRVHDVSFGSGFIFCTSISWLLFSSISELWKHS